MPELLCVECIKKKRINVSATIIYLGKSICNGCIPEALRSGQAFVEAISEFQKVMGDAAKENDKVSKRMNEALQHMEIMARRWDPSN